MNNALIFSPRVLKKLPIAVKPFFIATPRSANVFFLTANQRKANPPIPTTATEPITIPAIAPPESPSFLSGVGVISPPPKGFRCTTKPHRCAGLHASVGLSVCMVFGELLRVGRIIYGLRTSSAVVFCTTPVPSLTTNSTVTRVPS